MFILNDKLEAETIVHNAFLTVYLKVRIFDNS